MPRITRIERHNPPSSARWSRRCTSWRARPAMRGGRWRPALHPSKTRRDRRWGTASARHVAVEAHEATRRGRQPPRRAVEARRLRDCRQVEHQRARHRPRGRAAAVATDEEPTTSRRFRGSSGGSACAVAAGLVHCARERRRRFDPNSRRVAAGCSAWKPSRGRVSLYPGPGSEATLVAESSRAACAIQPRCSTSSPACCPAIRTAPSSHRSSLSSAPTPRLRIGYDRAHWRERWRQRVASRLRRGGASHREGARRPRPSGRDHS